MPNLYNSTPRDYTTLAQQIRQWGAALGFQHVGFSHIDLTAAEAALNDWLAAGRHGEMAYMAQHGSMRSRPAELVPGTLSIISARMDYLPPAADAWGVLGNSSLGYIARYALGRDYHKLVRARLQKLAARIQESIGPYGYRVFSDSAPVLEKPIAAQAGLGWVGKHSNLLSRTAGSWFFLGEIYTDLPLPPDAAASAHCGRCTACIDVCPTRAIVAPYTVDARRCISYLTIELHGAIPEPLRPLMGNRIYGCDDCQLVCPWNHRAQTTQETDFLPRQGLDAPNLLDLFAWSEEEFLHRTEGSALRRLGHERWLRNIAVALGNAPPHSAIRDALRARCDHPSALVREHAVWGLARQAD
jgi:epoxyqueuosine reductase